MSRPGRHPGLDGRRIAIRRATTAALTTAAIARIRAILEAAFAGNPDDAFRETDWEHATGGMHVLLDLDGSIVAHAAVVARELHVDGRPVRCGYVEAVATAPEHQRTGLGTLVMRDVAALIRERYELGALATGEHGFYERMGWRTWRGPTSVRTPVGEVATPGEDGCVMVLETGALPALDLDAPISCEARSGDAW